MAKNIAVVVKRPKGKQTFPSFVTWKGDKCFKVKFTKDAGMPKAHILDKDLDIKRMFISLDDYNLKVEKYTKKDGAEGKATILWVNGFTNLDVKTTAKDLLKQEQQKVAEYIKEMREAKEAFETDEEFEQDGILDNLL